MLDVGVFLWMVVAEAEVFELGLNLVETETVGKRCIDIERLARNLVLLVGRLRFEGSHVVQTITYLDENDADVVAHGEQQLLKVLSLCRGFVAKDTTANLGKTIYNLGYLLTKDVGDVFYSIVGVFHYVVQQGCTDTGGPQSHLLAGYLSHSDGVHDIGFTRQASYTLVGLACKVESFGDDVYLFAMA